MIEDLIAEQLQEFLNGTSALDPHQSGFRPGFGTTAILILLWDGGFCSKLILFDLTWVFSPFMPFFKTLYAIFVELMQII